MEDKIIRICDNCQYQHAKYQVGEDYFCAICYPMREKCVRCRHYKNNIEKCKECSKIASYNKFKAENGVPMCLFSTVAVLSLILILCFCFENLKLSSKIGIFFLIAFFVTAFVVFLIQKKHTIQSCFEDKENEYYLENQ